GDPARRQLPGPIEPNICRSAPTSCHMLILNIVPEGTGWDPINHLVALAAELFDADVIDIPDARPSLADRLAALLTRRDKSTRSAESCLLICATPAQLSWIFGIPNWRTRFSFLAAWVID